MQYGSSAENLPTRTQFRRWVKAALQHDVQIVLIIVGEPEARTLNKSYRSKDYATNVLTFVYDDETQSRHSRVKTHGAGRTAGRLLHGDIVLCAPVVKREAREQHKELAAHYAHLVIHAVLHLQGYMHDDELDASEMEKFETALMAKLGYADPYAVTS